MITTSYSDESHPLSTHIICGSFRLLSTSMDPMLTLEIGIRFHRYHIYVSDKLCTHDWVDCITCNSHVYHCVPPQSRWGFANLVPNNTVIVGRTISEVDIVGLLLGVMVTFSMVNIISPRQHHALMHNPLPRVHICLESGVSASSEIMSDTFILKGVASLFS